MPPKAYQLIQSNVDGYSRADAWRACMPTPAKMSKAGQFGRQQGWVQKPLFEYHSYHGLGLAKFCLHDSLKSLDESGSKVA